MRSVSVSPGPKVVGLHVSAAGAELSAIDRGAAAVERVSPSIDGGGTTVVSRARGACCTATAVSAFSRTDSRAHAATIRPRKASLQGDKLVLTFGSRG